jgi:hypothetical protein
MPEIKLTLKEKDIKKIEKRIDDTVSKYIEELPGRIWGILDKIVLGALGFSDSWGKIEVDRCNGREPFVAQFISAQAKKVCEEAIAKHELVLTPEFDVALRTEYAQRMQKQFEDYFDRKVGDHFDTMMKNVLDSSELKFDLKVDFPKTLKDLTNPNILSATPKLRDLILATVVERDAKESADKNK